MKDREYSTYMLLNAPGFGAKSVHYVYEGLKKFGLKITDLFDTNATQLKNFFPEIGRGKFSKADISILSTLDDDRLYNSYQKLKNENVHVIGLDDERYPKLLIERLGENAPPVLFCKGYLPLLNSSSISIVGSRDVSDFAVMLTKRIANRLAENGYNVTSGFAKGVDTGAHIGALEKNGTTTMILSYGFNHLAVKKEIKDFNWEKNTLFISQFMPYEKFSGQNAMVRNKLVCALSKAVIVISSGPEYDEQGKMSGTFDAGLTALKLKIPLFVLTPSLLNPVPLGNVGLIKLGGVALSNGNELVNYLNSLEIKIPGNIEVAKPTPQSEVTKPVGELKTVVHNNEDVKEKILSTIEDKALSAKEIIGKSGIDWTSKKLTSYLNYLTKIDEIEVVKMGRLNFYKRKAKRVQARFFA